MLSCIKDGNETWYSIRNNTGFDIICFFYAKSGKAVGNDKIIIFNNETQSFYWPGETQNSPDQIISDVYDSICINVLSADTTRIVFTPSQVKNYQVNLFTDMQAWKKNSFHTTNKTNFATQHVSVNEYYFEINRDSIIYAH
jgi:hypothetical protein